MWMVRYDLMPVTMRARLAEIKAGTRTTRAAWTLTYVPLPPHHHTTTAAAAATATAV